MATLRSWIGGILTLLVFFVARKFTHGLAAPACITIILASAYAWTCVLRVPELKGITPAEDEMPTNVGAGQQSEASAKASDSTTAEIPKQVAPATGASTKASDSTAAEIPKQVATTGAPTEAQAPTGPSNQGGSIHTEAPQSVPSTVDASAPEQTETCASASNAASLEQSSASSSNQPVPPQPVPTADKEVREAVEQVVDTASASEPVPQDFSVNSVRGSNVEEGAGPTQKADDTTAQVPRADSEAVRGEGSGQEGNEVLKQGDQNANATATSCAADDSEDDSEDEDELRRQEEEAEDAHCDPEKAQQLRQEGNEFFKTNKLHDAREAYSEALYLTPAADKKSRAVLFSNRAAVFQKLSRWDEVIDDCRQAIGLDPEYVKAYVRRSAAYEATSKWHDANEDLKKAIELDPALKSKEYKHQAVLEQRAHEQFEKDKEEMMDKLKGFGNMVLGKFGMSTDNFKCEKDPDSGSYSIKFQQ